MLDFKIADFPIAKRTINILLKSGIETVGQLEEKTVADLMEIPGMGKMSLGELRLFLSQSGFKLKKAPPKPKKELKYPKETKEVLSRLLGARVNNYAREYDLCGKLINHFGLDTMMNFEMHPNKETLLYYFSGGQISPWVDTYAKQFMRVTLVKAPIVEEKVEEIIEKVEYVPTARKPKTLAEFLKDR